MVCRAPDDRPSRPVGASGDRIAVSSLTQYAPMMGTSEALGICSSSSAKAASTPAVLPMPWAKCGNQIETFGKRMMVGPRTERQQSLYQTVTIEVCTAIWFAPGAFGGHIDAEGRATPLISSSMAL